MLKLLLKSSLFLFVAVGTCSLSAPSVAQQAEPDTTSTASTTTSIAVDSKAFIRDDLFVFMHTGPTRNYRILGSIVAGEPVSVLALSNDKEFTQIKDSQDRVGWVESRFLSQDLPAQQQLQMLSEQLTNTVDLESQLSLKNQQLVSQNEKLTNQLSALTQRLTDAETARDSAERALQNASEPLRSEASRRTMGVRGTAMAAVAVVPREHT